MCRALPPVPVYRVNDFLENLFLTVLDFQLHESVVESALEHYHKNCKNRIRTFTDLKRLLGSRQSNRKIARFLWGYDLARTPRLPPARIGRVLRVHRGNDGLGLEGLGSQRGL